MAKYWQIRESYGEKARNMEGDDAYECGYEDGYEVAMREMESTRSRMGERMGERRGRDSMGRFR